MSERDREIDELIEESMQNAAENGYAEVLAKLDDYQMMVDLKDCDATYEDIDEDVVLAGVKRWRSKQ